MTRAAVRSPRRVGRSEPTTRLRSSGRTRTGCRRGVIPADGSKPRELDLKSTYQPAHTVTLVGSGGKTANAKSDDAI